MATQEHDQLIRLGFSKRFLKTKSGQNKYVRKFALMNPDKLARYYCVRCRDLFVSVADMPDEPADERGTTFGDLNGTAQKAGFCSGKCMDEEANESQASNIHRAATLALRPDFYESTEWQELRYQVIKERGNHCECCGAAGGPESPIHVDHIKPRSRHPYLALTKSNLQVLCKECNFGKGAWDETDWRKSDAINQ